MKKTFPKNSSTNLEFIFVFSRAVGNSNLIFKTNIETTKKRKHKLVRKDDIKYELIFFRGKKFFKIYIKIHQFTKNFIILCSSEIFVKNYHFVKKSSSLPTERDKNRGHNNVFTYMQKVLFSSSIFWNPNDIFMLKIYTWVEILGDENELVEPKWNVSPTAYIH